MCGFGSGEPSAQTQKRHVDRPRALVSPVVDIAGLLRLRRLALPALCAATLVARGPRALFNVRSDDAEYYAINAVVRRAVRREPHMAALSVAIADAVLLRTHFRNDIEHHLLQVRDLGLQLQPSDRPSDIGSRQPQDL